MNRTAIRTALFPNGLFHLRFLSALVALDRTYRDRRHMARLDESRLRDV